MRKEAWPPFSELKSNMEPQGDPDRDISMDSNHFDTFVDGKHTASDSEELSDMLGDELSSGYDSGGIMFPLDDFSIEDETDFLAIASFSKRFLNSFSKNSTLLGVGTQTDEGASIILKNGHNLFNLSNSFSNNININNFHQEYGNPMFYNFNKKFDGFYITALPDSLNHLDIALKNIYSQLRPLGHGLIVSSEGHDISSNIENAGFDIKDKNINNIGIYFVSKNNLSKEKSLANFADFLIEKVATQKSIDYSLLFKDMLIKITDSDILNKEEILKDITKQFNSFLKMYFNLGNNLGDSKREAYQKSALRAKEYVKNFR